MKYSEEFGYTKKVRIFLNAIEQSEIKMRNFLKKVFGEKSMMGKDDFMQKVGDLIHDKTGTYTGGGDVWEILGGNHSVHYGGLVDFWKEAGEPIIVRKFAGGISR